MLLEARHAILRLIYLVAAVSACVGCFVVFSYATGPEPAIYYMAALSAFILGGITLLNVEFVFWDKSFLRRLISFLFWSIAGAATWVVSLGIYRWDWAEPGNLFLSNEDFLFVVVLLLLWPWMSLLLQAPLWAIRYFLGLRLVHRMNLAAERQPERWTIQDLGWGTALVALTAAGVRTATSDLLQQGADMAVVGWTTLGVIIFSFLIVLPATLCILRPHRALFAWLGFGVHCVVMLTADLSLAWATGAFTSRETVASVAVTFVVLFLGPVSGCFVLRWSGYRLVGKNIVPQSATPPNAGS